MPKKRSGDERIAFAPRQAEGGTRGGEICRKMGIARATFYRWKKVYAGMGGERWSAIGPRTMASEIRRLKQFEDETGKLRRLVPDLTPDSEAFRPSLLKGWNL